MPSEDLYFAMSQSITPLRHGDLSPDRNPTGEALLSRSTKPFEVWIPKDRCLVLGNSQDPEKELNVDHVVRDVIPVYKRMSGGGAVLLSPGCLCLGLRFTKRNPLSIQDYFAMGSGLVQKVVGQAMGVELESRGISDLVFQDRKVAGCALYMPKNFVLYLVSILFEPNFADIEKYLAHPTKEPEYRSGRTHADFLVGLASVAKHVTSKEDLIHRFTEEISASRKDDLDWELCEGPASKKAGDQKV